MTTSNTKNNILKIADSFGWLTILGHGIIIVGGSVFLLYAIYVRIAMGVGLPLTSVVLGVFTGHITTASVLYVVLQGIKQGESIATIIRAWKGH